jgi:hypothetical protein
MSAPIMGTELVGVRGWGYQRQRIAFARMHTGETTTRYYTEGDLEQLIIDMLSCADAWSVDIHWSIPEDYAEQFAQVAAYRRSEISYSNNEVKS